MDWASTGNSQPFRNYLFCININTRYLFVIPIDINKNPAQIDTWKSLVKINNSMTEDHKLKHIRGDADTTFGYHFYEQEPQLVSSLQEPKYVRLGTTVYHGNDLTWYLLANNIELSLFPSKYTNKNRIVDRVIRTIRDMLISNEVFLDNELVAAAVNKYNNTKHSAFDNKYSPAEVQSSHDLEEVFIRENLYRLDDVNKLQHDEGLLNYKPQNILLVNLDESKTRRAMDKRRRVFGRLAVFEKYEYGNVSCRLILRDKNNNIFFGNPITIPIYHTKFVSNNFDSIPPSIRNQISNFLPIEK
jgi:hypothetical protein